MLANVLLLSLSLLGSAVALPSPSSALAIPSQSSALAILSARGIDPTGPIPADAVPISGGGFSFEADSDTAHWVRAQNEIADTGLSKRENSGLSITFWTQNNCRGGGAFFSNVQYGVQLVSSELFYLSLELRFRELFGNEQLDYSTNLPGGTDMCAKYQRSAPNGAGPGCYTERAYSCVRLLKF